MTFAKPSNQFGTVNYSAITRKRASKSDLFCLSEIMTILIGFHQSHYRNFKAYYIHQVCKYWKQAFPKLVSYNRFVQWTPTCLFPLCCYLKTCFGPCTDISFIDATSLKVCHNRRIWQHRVCKDTAARGKLWWAGSTVTSCIYW